MTIFLKVPVNLFIISGIWNFTFLRYKLAFFSKGNSAEVKLPKRAFSLLRLDIHRSIFPASIVLVFMTGPGEGFDVRI